MSRSAATASQLVQPVGELRHCLWPHAEAVHAGVDLEEDLDGPRQMRGLEHAHLIDVVYDHGESLVRDLRELGRFEEAFEQQDAAGVALLAQGDRRVELDEREPVGIGEGGQHALQAVAVCVGLDHREELRACDVPARHLDVGPQRSEIDLGMKGSGHGRGARAVRALWGCPPGRKHAGSWYKARARTTAQELYRTRAPPDRTRGGPRIPGG